MDFSSTTDLESGLRHVSVNLLQFGVTSYLPTLVSSTPEFYREALPLLRPTVGTANSGAAVLGAHLEGPFINETKLGCHDKRYLCNFARGINSLTEVYGPGLSNAKIVTLAPELPGSREIISALRVNGIVVAAGHSMATVAQAEDAVNAGATYMTHLFNAMNQFHHRDPGLVGLLGSSEKNGFKRPFYSIIADGIHVHRNSVKIAHDAHPNGSILITDGMAGMGLNQGEHHLHFGSQNVFISQRSEAFLEGTSTLAGSVMTMPHCVRNFRDFTGCSLEEALLAASLHPAQVLGIQRQKGTLAFGADADFIVCDDDLNIRATFVNGQLAWKPPTGSF